MGSQCQGGSARQRASRAAGAGSGLGPRAAGLGRVSRGTGGGRGRTCRVGPSRQQAGDVAVGEWCRRVGPLCHSHGASAAEGERGAGLADARGR